MIYFYLRYDDLIFFFPKYHSLNTETAYCLIFNTFLSCFLLEIALLKTDIFLIVVWFLLHLMPLKIMHASTTACPS